MAIASTTGPADSEARLRSGTAARLAGLPVTTLRVWERRYGVVSAPKTATGQRLYSAHDVQRLTLLKQLSDRGHAIGTMANLAHDALQVLLASSQASGSQKADTADSTPADARGGRHVVVVGRLAAHKLKAARGLDLQAVYDDLDQAEAQAAAQAEAPTDARAERPGTADVLLVHLASLQPDSAERVLALWARFQAHRLVVLYAFGAESVAESLRAAGATLRREPIAGDELAHLLSAVRNLPMPAKASWQASPRRFTDDALAELAEIQSKVACECPRHLAEIVSQLAGFERYSADCLSRTPADAALHRHLSGLAGVARTMFEEALERVIVDEGLTVAHHPMASPA